MEDNDDSSSSDDDESEAKHHKHGDDSSSSSDDNDSTAAAHAAAIGHSPQPTRPTLDSSLLKIPEHLKQGPGNNSEKMASPKTDDAEDAKGIQGVKVANETRNDDTATNDKSSVATAAPVERDAKNPAATGKEDELAATATEEAQKESPEKDVNALSMDVEDEEEKADTPLEDQSNGVLKGPKAVATGQVAQKAKKLELNRDINLNERDEDENTALHVAIHARNLEHVKVLLEAGASFRIRCDGSMPIHAAISIGALRAHRQFAYECVVMLHEHGADLMVKDDAVHTPLFLACMFNLPQIVSYILSHDEGLSTLNIRADRAGNRPLHAAAKFDTLDNPSVSKAAASIATGQARPVPNRHHPDGSVISAMHTIPGYPGKQASHQQHSAVPDPAAEGAAVSGAPSTEALLTQVLLGTNGIEVDALNVLGQTPLHVACMRRNWPVARLLIQAGASPTITDRRNHTPGHLAHKRAMPIPNDLYDVLGDPPESGIVPPLRELIVDPDCSTLLMCHELCMLHRTCPPILRDSAEPPPENVRRLHVLVDPDTGILRSGEFSNLVWNSQARRAAIADVLKVGLPLFVPINPCPIPTLCFESSLTITLSSLAL